MRESDSVGLTAEQVREAIFAGSVYASYDGAQYYANGINMQAIADELNAGVDDALAILDEIHEADRISYDDYSRLFDAIATLGSGEKVKR